jgi:hypothetical protein
MGAVDLDEVLPPVALVDEEEHALPRGGDVQVDPDLERRPDVGGGGVAVGGQRQGLE